MMDTRPKVLVTDPEYHKGEACFTAASELECLSAPGAEQELAAAIRDVAGRYVIVGPGTYSGALYDAMPPGGVIARFGVGHDGINKKRATARRLFCTNTPGVLDRSVAEHAMLLLAAGARHLISATTGMANHAWQPRTGEELHGKTLVVVGCGGIGREVARIATLGYGMQVVGCVKPSATPRAIEHFQFVTNDFSEAVRAANFISLHIPDIPDNRHFINRERLTYFDSHAWLINTARGAVVDEAALFDALAGGKLGGAALDVFQREPYVPVDGNRDLRSLQNVVLTPHVGSNTIEANHRMAERALHNITLAVAGEFGKMDLLNREVLG
ncbi:MAG TPA: NAD(P)-dependent oxidoreductase [Vicinamibacterales bacterium]|nr:NAD(P)-dependent oxidoreductase [Vicinamibacterales bacterium]